MTKSKKDVKKRVKKFDFKMEPKNNNTSSHMLLDHCYPFGLSL